MSFSSITCLHQHVSAGFDGGLLLEIQLFCFLDDWLFVIVSAP